MQTRSVGRYLALLSLFTGCVYGAGGARLPDLAPVLRPAVAVAASLDRTWEAVIAWFAENAIAIQPGEKASGVVVAVVPELTLRRLIFFAPRVLDVDDSRALSRGGFYEQTRLNFERDSTWVALPSGPLPLSELPMITRAIYADCGDDRSRPDSASFRVQVRGGPASSTIQVTLRYRLVPDAPKPRAGRPTGEMPPGGLPAVACVSTGRWEGELETYVRKLAEAK